MYKNEAQQEGFKSIRVGATIHGSLVKEIYLIAKDPVNINNPINIFKKNWNNVWDVTQI